jgi:hypothetical protein
MPWLLTWVWVPDGYHYQGPNLPAIFVPPGHAMPEDQSTSVVPEAANDSTAAAFPPSPPVGTFMPAPGAMAPVDTAGPEAAPIRPPGMEDVQAYDFYAQWADELNQQPPATGTTQPTPGGEGGPAPAAGSGSTQGPPTDTAPSTAAAEIEAEGAKTKGVLGKGSEAAAGGKGSGSRPVVRYATAPVRPTLPPGPVDVRHVRRLEPQSKRMPRRPTPGDVQVVDD